MLQKLGKHVSPTSAVAVLALVLAMSGGALAATHYVITSTKQISPKVLKSLKGASGKNGVNGANGANGGQGPAGATGAAGPQGPAGPQGAPGVPGKDGKEGKEGKGGTTGFTETLPSGMTETGTWSARFEAVAEGNTTSAISFAIPLVAPLGETAVHYLPVEPCNGLTGEELTACEAAEKEREAVCPGNAEEPKAVAGNLCVYEGVLRGPEGGAAFISKITPPANVKEEGAGTSGAIAEIHFAGPEEEFALFQGSWAVTAP